MSVFPEGMKRINTKDTENSLKTIEDFITYMQERIDFSISHLKADYIVAGQITTDRLKLNGAITWEDLNSNVQTRIEAAGGTLTLQVTNGESSSLIQLKKDNVVISSDTINMTGLVTFTDLSTSGSTTINGANITTGVISADRLNLTGEITWSDLASSTVSNINSTATSAASTYCSSQNYLNVNTGVLKTAISGQYVMTESLVANNLTIKGGLIDIDTSASTYDVIKLNYSSYSSKIEPYGFIASMGTYTNTMSAQSISMSNSGYTTQIIAGSITCSGGYGGTGLSNLLGALDITSSTEVRINSTSMGNIMLNSYVALTNPVTASQDPVYRSTTSPYRLGTSSSLRAYKHDIENVKDEGLNPHHLYDLPVRQFYWNKDIVEDGGDNLQIGFIAEEMEENYPFACIYRDGKLASWGERNMIAPMLYLIQEQHQEIERLKETVYGQ